jgi:hypothetical protein
MFATMTRLRWGTVVALAALAGGPGCSLAFVSGPPQDHALRTQLDCSTSRLLPIGDMIGGTYLTAVALGSRVDNSNRSAAAPLTMLSAAVLASAAYGLREVRACRLAQRALTARQSQGELERFSATAVPVAPGTPDPWLAAGPPPSGFWPATPPVPAQPSSVEQPEPAR